MAIKKPPCKKGGFPVKEIYLLLSDYSAAATVSAVFGTLTFLSTKPALRQRVQIEIVLEVPPNCALILRRFGLHVLRVWLFDLLTLLPVIVVFPQISHILDISISSLTNNITKIKR